MSKKILSSKYSRQKKPTVLLCRPGYESSLAAESPPALDLVEGSGLLVTSAPPERPCVFERQRVPHASWLGPKQLNPISVASFDQLAAELPRRDWIWTIHAFSPDGSLDRKAEGLAKAFLRRCKERQPASHERYRSFVKLRTAETIDVLQLCYTEQGVWHGLTPVLELSDPTPGGIHRMRMDRDAPSRSYLKIEEALDRMAVETGVVPEANQSVIDLGAAPGGWSHAFLKRGCLVTAIDNGPMKLSHPALQHLAVDGMRFEPRPVDWLIADMLVAPGTCLGMLRRWLRARAPRHFIVNAKIPQQEPLPALAPLLAFLKTESDKENYRWSCRQLYHDRREVTLWGSRLKA